MPKPTFRTWFGMKEAALRWRLCAIEKLGNGSDELGRRERLGQKNAVGNAVRGPLIGRRARHVDDWKCRVDLSGLFADLPSVHLAMQIDVGDKRAVFGVAAL